MISEIGLNLIAKYETINLSKIKEISLYLEKNCVFELSQNQIDALGSIIHDIGIETFSGSRLHYVINTDPATPDVANFFMEWDKINGVEDVKRFERRRHEIEMYFYAE